MFDECGLEREVNSITGDIRDRSHLLTALLESNPDVVIHMAAQPLVRDSYHHPVETYETNVLGTVYLFEAVRQANQRGLAIKAVVNVTTDKCYDNKEWVWGYREYEPLGGFDPYSNSKACSELVTSAYRNSFFHPSSFDKHGVAIATARAGNVIGGGDWAIDRIVPDCFRALTAQKPVILRNPHAIRPWQHVLEPLSGYLLLARRLYEDGPRFAEGWNFGPNEGDARTVEWVVGQICKMWGKGATYAVQQTDDLHEAGFLKLDCSKANMELGWHPRWQLETAIKHIVEWMQAYNQGKDVKRLSLQQIERYERGK
jgi:CDP-glucose 4,6-dehydratase